MTLGAVAICGDIGFVNSGPGEFQNGPPSDSLQALNLTSGQTLWSVNLTNGYFIGYPITDGHLVYTEMDNGTIFAFAADSGTRVWKQTVAQTPGSATSITPTNTSGRTTTVTVLQRNGLVETPSLAEGKLYVTSTDGHLYAMNATTGKVIWSSDLGATITDTRESSALGYGEIFLGTSARLMAVNATNGSLAWEAPLNSTDTGTPTVVDGSVFIADFSGTLYQFNVSSGSLEWSFTGLGQGYVSEPIVAGGLVAVDGNNGVFAFR